MYKIAIIEQIHPEGIELLKKNSNFEYEIINDVSEENIKKIISEYDGVTLRVSKFSIFLYIIFSRNCLFFCFKTLIIN